MKTIFTILLVMAVLIGLLTFFLNTDKGAHVVGDFMGMFKAQEVQNDARAITRGIRQADKDVEANRQLLHDLHDMLQEQNRVNERMREANAKMNSDVGYAMARLREETDRVRQFYRDNAPAAEAASDMAQIDNLWQGMYNVWEQQKKEAQMKDYEDTLDKMRVLQEKLRAIRSGESSFSLGTLKEAFEQYKEIDTRRSEVSQQIAEKEMSIREVNDRLREKVENQKQQLKERMEAQQEKLRDSMDKTRDDMDQAKEKIQDDQDRMQDRMRSQQEDMREKMQQLRERTQK